MSDTESAVLICDGKSRKRKRNTSNTAREKAKIQRYKSKALPTKTPCCHKGTSYKCNEVKGKYLLSFFNAFYSFPDKLKQDAFILQYCSFEPAKRTERSGKGGSRKGISIKYLFRKFDGKIIKVCQKKFLNTLKISKDRVQRICKRHLVEKTSPVERRGGDRRTTIYLSKKKAIIDFIRSFKVLDIHYCRDRIARRQYLPGELNIKKMWRMYNLSASVENKVKKSYYRYVFNNNFNIGFKAPYEDMCSECISLKERIKRENNASSKTHLMAVYRIHKLRASAFYELLKEKRDDLLIISFDCQKNMVLPKVADQAAYYSRQFYMYMFGTVLGNSKSPLNKGAVHLYAWTENERPKGSVEIASAVFHRISNLVLDGIHTIRLIADGCGGQNRNMTMVTMLVYWLTLKAPPHVKKIELIFPVPGHSFIPPDRVFGKIEKEVKMKQNVINPEEYIEIYNSHGTVFRLGSSECSVLDWKNEGAKFVKAPAALHFQFNKTKRFILSTKVGKVVVRGEPFYKSNIGVSRSIVKIGKNIADMDLDRLECGIQMKDLKIKDVEKLLKKHYGVDWRMMDDLAFYVNIIDGNDGHNETQEEPDYCEQRDEELTLRI